MKIKKIYKTSNRNLLTITIIFISILNIISVFLDIPQKYFIFLNSLIIFIVALLNFWLCWKQK